MPLKTVSYKTAPCNVDRCHGVMRFIYHVYIIKYGSQIVSGESRSQGSRNGICAWKQERQAEENLLEDIRYCN